jgi:hypothetical protein
VIQKENVRLLISRNNIHGMTVAVAGVVVVVREVPAHSYGYSGSISKSEHKAMSPRSESDEESMVRIATEASLRVWEENRNVPRATCRYL